jgi:magnesium chelatase family protein
MLARVTTFALDGLASRRVAVEVDVRPGLPAFSIVGLGDKAVREARERVRAAILNSGFEFPLRRIVANLAPAYLRKAGPGFDLAIACGVLAASGQLPADALAGWALFGELSLSGELRACRGTLAVAEGVERWGPPGLILARERAHEAALVDGIRVAGIRTLADVAGLLRGGDPPELPDEEAADGGSAAELHALPDLADVRGQAEPLRALTIAAAGGHNLLLSGPPGTGKTMLAQRVPGILPALSRGEAIEVTRIQSIAGLHRGASLVDRRPFRAPHHSISASGLIGGGSIPSPGEVTLAHHGVLFLDELPEFARPSLEALRQPLEDGLVSVVRSQRAAIFPSRFMLVASTNLCPCGPNGSKGCTCSPGEVERYLRRLSGPLLDRMDLLVPVERPTVEELSSPPVTSSAEVRERVAAARERQLARLAPYGHACNAHMGPRAMREALALAPDAERMLHDFYDQGALSARGHQRVARVARTIADLEGQDRVTASHVGGALLLRQGGSQNMEAA